MPLNSYDGHIAIRSPGYRWLPWVWQGLETYYYHRDIIIIRERRYRLGNADGSHIDVRRIYVGDYQDFHKIAPMIYASSWLCTRTDIPESMLALTASRISIVFNPCAPVTIGSPRPWTASTNARSSRK